jgi:hypothetical protein
MPKFEMEMCENGSPKYIPDQIDFDAGYPNGYPDDCDRSELAESVRTRVRTGGF